MYKRQGVGGWHDLAIVARLGDSAPGYPLGTTLQEVGIVAHSRNGHVIVEATAVEPSGEHHTAYFRWHSGVLERLVEVGEAYETTKITGVLSSAGELTAGGPATIADDGRWTTIIGLEDGRSVAVVFPA